MFGFIHKSHGICWDEHQYSDIN